MEMTDPYDGATEKQRTCSKCRARNTANYRARKALEGASL